MKAWWIRETETASMRDAFLDGREAHRALVRHMGPNGPAVPDCGVRVSVGEIDFDMPGAGRYRVTREPQGICVRRVVG